MTLSHQPCFIQEEKISSIGSKCLRPSRNCWRSAIENLPCRCLRCSRPINNNPFIKSYHNCSIECGAKRTSEKIRRCSINLEFENLRKSFNSSDRGSWSTSSSYAESESDTFKKCKNNLNKHANFESTTGDPVIRGKKSSKEKGKDRSSSPSSSSNYYRKHKKFPNLNFSPATSDRENEEGRSRMGRDAHKGKVDVLTNSITFPVTPDQDKVPALAQGQSLSVSLASTPVTYYVTPLEMPPLVTRTLLPAPVFSTILNSFKKRTFDTSTVGSVSGETASSIVHSTKSAAASSGATASATASSLALRRPPIFSSTTPGGGIIGKQPNSIPQRKAQPHILMTKTQRNLTLNSVSNSLNVVGVTSVSGGPSGVGVGVGVSSTVQHLMASGQHPVNVSQHQGGLAMTSVGVSVGGSMSMGSGLTKTTGFNLPISSLKNFPGVVSTLTVGMGVGGGMSYAHQMGHSTTAKTSQGANIIFVQKTSSGFPCSVGSAVNVGAASVSGGSGVGAGPGVNMQQLPNKNSPRAVILRRANMPRQGNVMILDQVVNANQVLQFLQTARILNCKSPSEPALLANLQKQQGGTVRTIAGGTPVVVSSAPSSISFSSSAGGTSVVPSSLVSSSSASTSFPTADVTTSSTTSNNNPISATVVSASFIINYLRLNVGSTSGGIQIRIHPTISNINQVQIQHLQRSN